MDRDSIEQEIQDAFHNAVGEILTFLDEEGTSRMLKRVVKATLWQLADNKIKPLIADMIARTMRKGGE